MHNKVPRRTASIWAVLVGAHASSSNSTLAADGAAHATREHTDPICGRRRELREARVCRGRAASGPTSVVVPATHLREDWNGLRSAVYFLLTEYFLARIPEDEPEPTRTSAGVGVVDEASQHTRPVHPAAFA